MGDACAIEQMLQHFTTVLCLSQTRRADTPFSFLLPSSDQLLCAKPTRLERMMTEARQDSGSLSTLLHPELLCRRSVTRGESKKTGAVIVTSHAGATQTLGKRGKVNGYKCGQQIEWSLWGVDMLSHPPGRATSTTLFPYTTHLEWCLRRFLNHQARQLQLLLSGAADIPRHDCPSDVSCHEWFTLRDREYLHRVSVCDAHRHLVVSALICAALCVAFGAKSAVVFLGGTFNAEFLLAVVSNVVVTLREMDAKALDPLGIRAPPTERQLSVRFNNHGLMAGGHPVQVSTNELERAIAWRRSLPTRVPFHYSLSRTDRPEAA